MQGFWKPHTSAGKPSISSGPAMLLKSMLGIDPAEFMAAIGAMVEGVRETKEQLNRIEAMLNAHFSPQANTANSEVSAGTDIPIRSAGLLGGDIRGHGATLANGGIVLGGDISLPDRT